MITFYSSTANNTQILATASLFEKNHYLTASYAHRKRKAVFKFCKEQKSVLTKICASSGYDAVRLLLRGQIFCANTESI